MHMESGFRKKTSVPSALSQFLEIIEPPDRAETIRIDEADGRVLSEEIIAPRDVPHYDRSAMDGYAVFATDTFGGSIDAGVQLKLIAGDRLGRGECIRVHTGSAVPEGADAVVMVENTERAGDFVEILGQVSPGQNIGKAGEDIKKDSLVFQKGHRIKSSDIGLLASMGILEVKAFCRPAVMIIPTGNEVVPTADIAKAGQVRESNGVMCLTYVRRFGGIGQVHDIVRDDAVKLADVLRESVPYDLIVTIGGSSVGERDLTVDVVNSMGSAIVHGVAIKPGKPVALGFVESEGRRAPIVCLPGYPAACAIDAMVFVDPAIKKLGRLPPSRYHTCQAVLARKIFSESGYRTYTRVTVEDGMATPLRTKGAGILSSISRADGYVIIPEDVEGYDAGSKVEVVFLE